MKPNENIIKIYPKKGPLSLFRFEKIILFKCIRCKDDKKAKLISIFNNDWEIKICNGCYGRLLSLYDNYEDIILDEEKIIHKNIIKKDYSAKDKIITTKSRGSMQKVFANIVKNNYSNRCAITNITTKSLLIAAHIIPWADDENKRIDPQNGICFSILIEKCFDRGFLTIDSNYNVKIVDNAIKEDEELINYLKKYDGKKINLPKESEFYPSINYFQHHWKKFSIKI